VAHFQPCRLGGGTGLSRRIGLVHLEPSAGDVPLVRGSTGIEACAGDLERIHMKTGESLVGAYQGRYIFVDKEAIRSADRMSGQHWRLFFDDQRKALDKSLNAHDMVFTTQR
jgi:hypothetical protein